MNKKTNNIFKQIPKGWQTTDIGLIPEEWEREKSKTAEAVGGWFGCGVCSTLLKQGVNSEFI